jgi:hypothetical protein
MVFAVIVGRFGGSAVGNMRLLVIAALVGWAVHAFSPVVHRFQRQQRAIIAALLLAIVVSFAALHRTVIHPHRSEMALVGYACDADWPDWMWILAGCWAF